jgi:hypothetical protein
MSASHNALKKAKSGHTGVTMNPYNTQSQSTIKPSQINIHDAPAAVVANTVSPDSCKKRAREDNVNDRDIAQEEEDSKCSQVIRQPRGDRPLKSIKRLNKGKTQTTITQQFKRQSTRENNEEDTHTKSYSFSFSCSPSYSSQEADDDFDSLVHAIGGNRQIEHESDKFCDVRGFNVDQDGPKLPNHYCHCCRCPPIKCHEYLLGEFIELDIVSEVMDAEGADPTPRDIENAVREKYEWHFRKLIYDDTKTLDVRKYKVPLCIEQKTLGRLYDYIKVSSYHYEKMKLITDGRGRKMTGEMLAARRREIEEDAS